MSILATLHGGPLDGQHKILPSAQPELEILEQPTIHPSTGAQTHTQALNPRKGTYKRARKSPHTKTHKTPYTWQGWH